MMKCPNCGNENSDTAKFCKNCGTEIVPTETTFKHEDVIESISGKKSESSGDGNTKKIIIGLAIVAVILACVFVYAYAFNGFGASDSGTQVGTAGQSSVQVNDDKADSDSSSSSQSEPAKTAQSSKPKMSILGGSFSTGSAEEDKTYAQIYVGTEHAGEDVIVQIFYSRDGNSLNNGNMVPASVHSDGYLYITSADAYHYYPDYATIKLYDSNSNLMDTQSVSLSPNSGTQTF